MKRTKFVHLETYFAIFAFFAFLSLREPSFRRSTPCVFDSLAVGPARLCQQGQGLTYALRALVPPEEVGYFGPAHAVWEGSSQGFEDLVRYYITCGIPEDVAGAFLCVIPHGEGRLQVLCLDAL